tara:strand:+ start:7547 stop:8731 length:1185 start_codon:yes stop_codon:yes gene_type:complete
MPDNYNIMDKGQAKKSIKSLLFEASNLTPSSLMTFFEVDLSTVVKSIGSSLVQDGTEVGINFETAGGEENILRFHNNIKAMNCYIYWQGNTYFPAPIHAEGFDISARGTLPTPILRVTAQKEEGIEALSILRRAIHKYGDIIGAKVTRIRTFAKYLDSKNFSDISQINNSQGSYANPFPDQYEPDPYAEFPRDIFYVERKSNENKINIEYELSALLDVEGIKLPRRRVLSQRCSFTYRGCGCFYEQKANSSGIYEKCDLRQSQLTMPEDAPPVATDKDEDISRIVGGTEATELKNAGIWSSSRQYEAGEYVSMQKGGYNYYFVAKTTIPSGQGTKFAPPNPDYWVADMCSKSLTGCRKRWGTKGSVVIGETKDFVKGELQYGGFPNATRLDQTN